MKQTKKILSLVLAMMLLFSTVSFSVNAAETYGEWGYYILEDGTLEIGRYYGEDFNVTVPSEINGMIVTSIGNSAFYTDHSPSILSITIPDSVRNIDYAAFNGCYNLKKIYLGKGVETIDDRSWTGQGDDDLTEILVDKDNPYYSNDEKGVLFNKDKTKLVKYPAGRQDKEYVIPSSVKTIGYMAMSSAALKNVVIPNSVEIIEEYAFIGTSLEKINIPGSIKSISLGAFSGTDAKEIVIPGNVKSIGERAFYSTRAEEIVISDGVIEIGKDAFANNYDLVKIVIGQDVAAIGEGAFGNNKKLETINVDEANMYFCSDNGVLYTKDKTKLIQYPLAKRESSFEIPYGVEIIGYGAFGFPSSSSTCYLTYLTIPNTVTKIEAYVFTFFEIGSTGSYISDIYYKGSEEQWNGIAIQSGNGYLEKIKIHFDSNSDGVCDKCGVSYTKKNCSHFCHKNSAFFKKFWYPMLAMFWELFGINQRCKCGMLHY